MKQTEEEMPIEEEVGEGSTADLALVEIAASSEVAIEDPKLAVASFAKVEKSLISLGFFTPSSRRIKEQKVKRITFTREIEGKRVEATAEFHPSAVFGLPITADQDKYLALHDIITKLLHTDGKISNPIRFTSADLLRLLNKRVRTGKNYKDISEWLDVMTATMIVSNGVVYEAGKKRWARDRFHVFERAVSVGKELPDGTIADANYVWLSEWQLENINQKFLLPIDLLTYRELKYHIAKALVPLLQIWLFASMKKGSYEKRYDELCEMLSLQNYRTPSQILRQLKPSLDELTKYEYLEKWRIEKTTDRKAYKIILFHGPKFHRDRRKQLDRKNTTERSIVIAESEPIEPALPEPGKLEAATARPPLSQPLISATQMVQPKIGRTKNIGQTGSSSAPVEDPEPVDEQSTLIDDLVARGLMPSVAIKLLNSVPAEQIERVRDYIEYFDSNKNVGPGFLHELIKNLPPLPSKFVTSRQREIQRREAKRNRDRWTVKEALTQGYKTYRDEALDRFIAEQLTTEEFERRVQIHRRKQPVQTGFETAWNSQEMALLSARHAVRAEIEKEMNFLPFEEFRKTELPRILAEAQLDPVELGIELPAQPSTA